MKQRKLDEIGVTTTDVLQAIEEEKNKRFRVAPKTRKYFTCDESIENIFDTKDIYARAASIKTGAHYTCHDFSGGIDGRVATIMSDLLKGTGYRIEEKNERIDELVHQMKQNEKRAYEEYVSYVEKDTNLLGSDRECVIKARINQGLFRDQLLEKYNHCCLCGITRSDLLIASHIKPWSSSDMKERVDVNNGLLLCPNHDKLFDRFLITFEDDGKILISDKIDIENQKCLGIDLQMRIEVNQEMMRYLQYHRQRFQMMSDTD